MLCCTSLSPPPPPPPPPPPLGFCLGVTDGIQLFLFCEGATDGVYLFQFCVIGLQEGRQSCYCFSHCQNICDALEYIYSFFVKLCVLSVLSFPSCHSYLSRYAADFKIDLLMGYLVMLFRI